MNILAPEERVTAEQYRKNVLKAGLKHILIDVRPVEMQANKLEHAVTLPLARIVDQDGVKVVSDLIGKTFTSEPKKVFVMCQRGFASQKATRELKNRLEGLDVEVKDIIGGIEAWSN